jgi:hypothetical protein
MTDPLEDQLRQALTSDAARFSPVETMGATRDQVIGRVRRRKRQVSLGLAAVLLVAAGAVALQMGRPGDSPRQVAAIGGDGSASTASGTTATGSGDPGPSGVSVSPGAVGVVVTPTVGVVVVPPSSVPGAPRGTTLPAPATTITTPTTSPGVTSVPTTTASTGSQVGGTVLFGPTCPVEQNPPNPACAPRPGPAHIQPVRINATVAAQGDAGSDGQFAISVAPGTYLVQAQSTSSTGGIGRGCTVTPAEVSVAPDTRTTVAVSCDTGIR